MQTLRAVTVVWATLSLLVGPAGVTAGQEDETRSMASHVAGSLEVRMLPGGSFDVQDRVFQYRHYPMSGRLWEVSDSRLAGYIMSDWSWDVSAHGGDPKPAWGTIAIAADDGGWTGDFTGVQYRDFEPVALHASLVGEGANEGLNATLDILSTGLSGDETWMLDGVIQSAPEA